MSQWAQEPEVIRAQHVSVAGTQRPRLHDVSVSVHRGRVSAIIGANGSGKSTLLEVLSAEISPEAGEVTYASRPAGKISARVAAQERALLAQSTPMAFSFSVLDVVSWGRIPWQGTDRQGEDDEAIAQAMTDTRISHLVDRRISELSGGEQARVHLARVLAQRAKVLLLDEADATLDVAGQGELDAIVSRRRDAGDAIVLVSHDLSRVSMIADHVVALREGECLTQGAVDEVFTEAVLSETFDIPMQVTTTDTGKFVHRSTDPPRPPRPSG